MDDPSQTDRQPPIDTRPLFAPLDQALIQLLRSLTAAEWQYRTIAPLWSVKDIAVHLLDGNLRTLSIQRDRHFGERPPEDPGYRSMVDWLNRLNADWVQAFRRVSPEVLMMLHEATGEQVSAYYSTLSPWDEAIFPVAWAGEPVSCNWMHVAREYTEKWLHQQQIRDATGRPGILTPQFFIPFMDTFLRGLPHRYSQQQLPDGTVLSVSVCGETEAERFLCLRDQVWSVTETAPHSPHAALVIPCDVFWKLFSKGMSPGKALPLITITGKESVALPALELIAVMA